MEGWERVDPGGFDINKVDRWDNPLWGDYLFGEGRARGGYILGVSLCFTHIGGLCISPAPWAAS